LRRENLRNERKKRKNQVKWKVGYTLDEQGNVSKSKGLKKLHELEALNGRAGPSSAILHRFMAPALVF